MRFYREKKPKVSKDVCVKMEGRGNVCPTPFNREEMVTLFSHTLSLPTMSIEWVAHLIIFMMLYALMKE